MARIWISYRENFPPLNGYQSDFGWGCTLRSAQMLIAQALMLEKFGRGTFGSTLIKLCFYRLASLGYYTLKFGQYFTFI
jgi:cysteine protease ATG4